MSETRLNKEKFDSVLLSLLSNIGNIHDFLDVFFSFLMRKTDFFRNPTEENPNIGFPEGEAKKLVAQTFLRYQEIMKNNIEKIEESKKAQTVTANPVEKATTKPKEIPLGAPQASRNDENGPVYLADSECYNGANREKYSWSQRINELDIIIKMPDDIKSTKDFDVQIKKDSILVKRKDGREIINDKLCYEIKAHSEYCMWTYQSNKITITADKKDERWWDALFISEEKIDTSKIDCSRPMTDLDEETMARIDQAKYDQRQKERGLPTSEEQKVHNVLKDAWNAEGSPFAGTNFDPKMVNVSSSSSS